MKVSRLPFAAFAIVNLLIGFWTGLLRIGVDVPVTAAATHHGAIMVGGFLGTLILLEKVIPLRNRLLYLFPLIGAASVLFFLADEVRMASVMQLIASAGLVGVYILYLRKDRSPALLMMGLGSLWWLTGNATLLDSRSYPSSFPWWMAFILFTIVGERLELSRFLPVSQRAKVLIWLVVFVLPISILTPYHSMGRYLTGVSLAGAAVWLLRHDVVRITLKKEGLVKYTAVALLGGYFFLLLCGVIFLFADHTLPFTYDLTVHVFFLGFTFCMIFAHGPIILPGVLGSSIKPYHPVLYGWLWLLIVGVLLRMIADASEWIPLRQVSAIINVVAILSYFPTLGILIRKARVSP